MSDGKSEAAWFEENAKIFKGWGFTTEGKVVTTQKLEVNYEDTHYPSPSNLCSTKKIAQKQRDSWMEQSLPWLKDQAKTKKNELKELKKRIHRFEKHLQKVRLHAKKEIKPEVNHASDQSPRSPEL